MKPAAWTLSLLLLVCGCSGNNNSDGGSNPDGGGQPDAGGLNGFKYVTLDTLPADQNYTGMAVSSTDTVGYAYFVKGDGGVMGSFLLEDGGTGMQQTFQNWDLRYVQWSAATGASTAQVVVTVQDQGKAGVAVGFQPNGQPVLAYFGGPNKTAPFGGGNLGANPYWFQQNMMLNYRQTDGVTWKEVMVDDYSMNLLPNNHGNTADPCLYNGTGPDSNTFGMILGIYPAMVMDAAGNAYLVYRDVHQGQFPIQDWGSSDMKIAIVPPSFAAGNPTTSFCSNNANNCQGLAWGGSNHGSGVGYGSYGGHNSVTLGPNGKPAAVCDQVIGGATGRGSNVLFFQNTGATAWTCSDGGTQTGCGDVSSVSPYAPVYCATPPPLIAQVGNTGNGPVIQWQPDGGPDSFGVTYVDQDGSQLYYLSSSDGVSWIPDNFFGSGTGGFDPSLAFDPFQEPNISFHMCAGANGATTCDPPSTSNFNGSNIQIGYRTGTGGGASWQFIIVDKDGYYQTKLGFTSNGHYVLTYLLGDSTPRLAYQP